MNTFSALPWETLTLLTASSVAVLGAIYWVGTGSMASGKSDDKPSDEQDDEDLVLRGPGEALGEQIIGETAGESTEDQSADESSPREYAFRGRHLLASYTGCSVAALHDVDGLTKAVHDAVAASGATLLDSVRHIFPPHGMTAVVLLSESHASIHTYPEHRSCFVDIFTCGTSCQVEAFDAALRKFLKPQRAKRRIIDRHDDMLDEATSHAAA
jgi:S-adenosylmethionine decarboxylase